MICFIHIEKAAGTSFHSILKKHISNYLVLKAFHQHGGEFSVRQLQLLLRFFPKIEGIGGHRIRPYLNYESVFPKKIEYITVIRPPLERYLSHYFHHLDKHYTTKTLDQFFTESYFDDFMCKKICGKPSAKNAIDLINKKNIKILFLEDIYEYEIKNTALTKRNYSRIIMDNFRKIEKCNLEDIKLFESLKERGSDINYFKENIISNNTGNIFKLGNLKIHVIQEIFQPLFYYLSGKNSEGLKKGY